MKSSLPLFVLSILSATNGFATVHEYGCEVVPKLSVGTYEAMETFRLSVGKSRVVYENEELGSCAVDGKDDPRYLSILYADGILKDCGYDGVDFLIPETMKAGQADSPLVVWADGAFDIYFCKQLIGAPRIQDPRKGSGQKEKPRRRKPAHE